MLSHRHGFSTVSSRCIYSQTFIVYCSKYLLMRMQQHYTPHRTPVITSYKSSFPLVPTGGASAAHHPRRNYCAILYNPRARGVHSCSSLHMESINPWHFHAVLMQVLSRKHQILWNLAGKRGRKALW